ncbi:MAG TPA: hypothetical protein VFT98_16995 [Myxococcota bacterium]|nr:hypothetical protein [Myxococcota bacterium]
MRKPFHSRRRRKLAALAGAAALFTSASVLSACEDEPDNLGEAIEEIGDDIEEAGEEIEDEIDDAT